MDLDLLLFPALIVTRTWKDSEQQCDKVFAVISIEDYNWE